MNPRHREISRVVRKVLNESHMIQLSQNISRRFYELGKQECSIRGAVIATELESVFRSVYGDALASELRDAMPDDTFLDRLENVGLARSEAEKMAITAWEVGLELSRIRCLASPNREPMTCTPERENAPHALPLG